jgi:signal recognition particle receptor subunit beta
VAQVDFNERQLTLKLVYFGPPRSGKTTNLRALHDRVDASGRGRLMTLDTKDDRTLFFDLLPIFFRTTALSFRIKVYTVPGQPMHEATRRVVLAGADGVVFVADSSPAQIEANRESWEGLARSRADLDLAAVPMVVQYNKRDLPDAVALERAIASTRSSGSIRPARAPAMACSPRSSACWPRRGITSTRRCGWPSGSASPARRSCARCAPMSAATNVI